MFRTFLRLDCINFSKQTRSIQDQLNGIFHEQSGTDSFCFPQYFFFPSYCRSLNWCSTILFTDNVPCAKY